MLITVDSRLGEPLYLQIRNQIVAGIATGELGPGAALPSVRTLASDLGINLHTVNKAYAVLRDEGYVRMRGRAGASIADPAADGTEASEAARGQMEESLSRLALAFRARGGAAEDFLETAAEQVARVYGTAAARADASAGDPRSEIGGGAAGRPLPGSGAKSAARKEGR